jgi:hypothetical protein
VLLVIGVGHRRAGRGRRDAQTRRFTPYALEDLPTAIAEAPGAWLLAGLSAV